MIVTGPLLSASIVPSTLTALNPNYLPTQTPLLLHLRAGNRSRERSYPPALPLSQSPLCLPSLSSWCPFPVPAYCLCLPVCLCLSLCLSTSLSCSPPRFPLYFPSVSPLPHLSVFPITTTPHTEGNKSPTVWVGKELEKQFWRTTLIIRGQS